MLKREWHQECNQYLKEYHLEKVTLTSEDEPIIEFVSGALVAILAWHFGPTLDFAATALLTLVLIALTGIDLDEMLLPDTIVGGLIVGMYLPIFEMGNVFG